eukprot:gene18047-25302_t
MNPIKEKQDLLIPGIIDQNIPNRNGFIYILSGSGGSEKERKKLEKSKKKTQQFEGVEIIDESDDDDTPDIQYSCVIIDDMADSLKDMDILRQLNKMLIKARH